VQPKNASNRKTSPPNNVTLARYRAKWNPVRSKTL
jgi:hypothetical protein